jgi:hypothetical protein
MAAFNLGAKSNNTRVAWRHLNAEVIKFNQGILKEEEVIKAYEAIIILLCRLAAAISSSLFLSEFLFVFSYYCC